MHTVWWNVPKAKDLCVFTATTVVGPGDELSWLVGLCNRIIGNESVKKMANSHAAV